MGMRADDPLRLTAEEFYDFVRRPENADKVFELVRGEVVKLPPPSEGQRAVCAILPRLLGNFCFGRRKGYVTGGDSGVILDRDPATVRGPDVAVHDDAHSW